jgi:hypothetical protein
MKYLATLEEIWQVYEFQRQTLKLIRRTANYVEKQDPDNESISAKLLAEVGFGEPLNTITDNLDRAKREIDNFVILSLWSVFEMCLIEYLQNHTQFSSSDAVAQLLNNRIRGDIERWKVNDKIDMTAPLFTPNLIDKLKQIKNYRNWVAHRNPSAEPENITPKDTYRDLREVI